MAPRTSENARLENLSYSFFKQKIPETYKTSVYARARNTYKPIIELFVHPLLKFVGVQVDLLRDRVPGAQELHLPACLGKSFFSYHT